MDTFNLNPEKTGHFFVSCNEDMFHPLPHKKTGHQFIVLYYSTYLPLHGVDYIVKAAKILEAQQEIRLRLIGNGPSYQTVQHLARRLKVTNTDFIPPVPYAQLPLNIAQADLCLAGPFGETAKARRVIPGKLFQFLAMARPTIAGDTGANRELLSHRHSSYLSPVASVTSLVAAVTELKEDDQLRKKLAETGYRQYQDQASEQKVSEQLYKIIEKFLK